jgi:excinuclease UvrABC helicase subunit UvrB
MAKIRGSSVKIFPAKHYILAENLESSAINSIMKNYNYGLIYQVILKAELSSMRYDLEMIGNRLCSGIRKTKDA